MSFVRNALIVIFIGIAIAAYRSLNHPAPPQDKWHEGAKWQRLLAAYNETIRQTALSRFETRKIDTRFGRTHVFSCGKESALPPVLLFHGAASSSMIYRSWLTSKLCNETLVITVDFPCDIGFSSPPDGDVSKCPQSQAELVQWVKELLDQMSIKRPVSVVGYSYGAFIATSVALLEPQLVARVVAIAPAAVFAPVQLGWTLRAVAYYFVPGRWFFDYMSADKETPYLDTLSDLDREYVAANNELKVTSLPVQPYAFSDDELSRITKRIPTLLAIGEQETVTDHVVAVATAKRNGVQVEVLPKAGHLLLVEAPANAQAEQVVVEFLTAP